MEYEEYFKCLQPCFNSEVKIKVTEPPNYISELKIADKKYPIIFIYKEETPEHHTFKYENGISSSISPEESLANLSVTGQPLECPFEKEDEVLDETLKVEPVVFTEDHYFAPVTFTEARQCISFLSLKMGPPPLPIWMLLDATDKKRQFLMGCEIKEMWHTRMWAVVHSNQTEKLPIKHMVDDFEKTFKAAAGYKRSSAVSCLFNIKDEPGMAKNSKCFLEVNWQHPSYEVPLSQADTFLIIECNVGQEDCQVSRWWQQLLLIHKYLEIIKQQKQSSQLQMKYERDRIELPSFKSGKKCDVPLATQVRDLLKVSDSMSVCRQIAAQQDTSALNATIQHLLKDNLQKGQDVTDRLWSLLIGAETYQELAESFQIIIREVRKQSVKPYIFAKNRTRLACLLRNIKTSTGVELMQEPLELMVEMGIEKLKRDYIFIFMSSQLASIDTLSLPKLPNFNEVGSDKWVVGVEAELQWLAQIHTVLELMSVVHSSLSVATMVQVTTQALSTFVRPDGSPVSSLSFLINNRTYRLRTSVTTKEVRNFIEGDQMFYKWMLMLSADNDFIRFSTTYVFLEESPLPLKILNHIQLQGVLDNTENLTESLEEMNCSSKLEQKYTYIQLNTASNKLPS